MVVGVLVLLAMIGMTFVIVAFADRREADSIARGGPLKKVAFGVLTKIQATLIEDLHFNADPANSTHPYEAALTWMDQVDDDHKDVDPWLASAMPGISGKYARASNLSYDTVTAAASFDDVEALLGATPDTPMSTLNGWMIDTDGDGKTDSMVVDTGVRDAAGAKYYVAVRIIDLCARINVNTAFKPDSDGSNPMTVRTFEEPMLPGGGTRGLPVTHMNWDMMSLGDGFLLHDPRSRANKTALIPHIATYWSQFVRCQPSQMGHGIPEAEKAQSFFPAFYQDDLLALLWRETDSSEPSYAARGRLVNFLGTVNLAAKGELLTTYNAARILPLQIPTAMGGVLQTARADMNEAGFDELANAFYNSLPRGQAGLTDGADVDAQDAKRRRLAAQLAVNLMDFRDTDSDVTVQDVPGASTKVYGIERQPFVTEAFVKAYNNSGAILRYSAFELINPYTTDLVLKGLKLTEGGTEKTPVGGWAVGGITIPAGGRLVFVSSATAFPLPAGVPTITVNGLDIAKGVKLYRARKADGTEEKDVLLTSVTLDVAAPAPGAAKTRVRVWDDRLAQARYTLAEQYADATDRDYTSENATPPATAATTNLGKANDDALVGNVTSAVGTGKGHPTPVYVRNGGFVSVGEMDRIFHVGPGENGSSLAGLLRDGSSLAQGRLDAMAPHTSISGNTDQIPTIPVACLASEFFTVINPMVDGIDNDADRVIDEEYEKAVYGVLNLNTAYDSLLCLPYMTSQTLGSILDTYGAGETPTLATTGQFLTGIRAVPGAKSNDFGPNYRISDGYASDDGLAPVNDPINDDLVKHQALFNRMANLVSVRSDTFAAYITVLKYKKSTVNTELSEPDAVRRYIAVLDRSNCYKRGDWPKIHMFVPIK